MQIPLPYDIIPIEKWYAFKTKLPPNQDNRHRVVIIHKDLAVLNYFCVTSQVEKAIIRAKHDTGSIAELKPSDWDVLTKPSCIECNKGHLYKINETDFKQMYKRGEVDYLGKVPETVKNAIIQAVCASETFTEDEKALYTT